MSKKGYWIAFGFAMLAFVSVVSFVVYLDANPKYTAPPVPAPTPTPTFCEYSQFDFVDIYHSVNELDLASTGLTRKGAASDIYFIMAGEKAYQQIQDCSWYVALHDDY